MGPFTCDGASTVAVDSVLCSLDSVPIFPHGKNAVHGIGAVAVSCKRTLKSFSWSRLSPVENIFEKVCRELSYSQVPSAPPVPDRNSQMPNETIYDNNTAVQNDKGQEYDNNVTRENDMNNAITQETNTVAQTQPGAEDWTTTIYVS